MAIWLWSEFDAIVLSRPAIELGVFHRRSHVVAVIFGLYAMHRLLAVREEGEVEGDVVIPHVAAEAREAVRHVSNVAGSRHRYAFPFADVEKKAIPETADQPPVAGESKNRFLAGTRGTGYCR